MKPLTLLVTLALALTLTACQRTEHSVRYEVDGTATNVRITYRNASGGDEQHTDIPLPWSTEFTAETLEWLHVRVSNITASGTVSCKILIDGEVFKEAESSGALTYASCGGLLPVEATPTPTTP
jgi:hypothetical protein